MTKHKLSVGDVDLGYYIEYNYQVADLQLNTVGVVGVLLTEATLKAFLTSLKIKIK